MFLKNVVYFCVQITHHYESYWFLRVVFRKAMEVANGNVPEIQVQAMDGGQYRATITVSFASQQLHGDIKGSIVEAKVSAMLVCLKHIEDVAGYQIVDLNFFANKAMDHEIGDFSRKLKLIWTCGCSVHRLLLSGTGHFSFLLGELDGQMSNYGLLPDEMQELSQDAKQNFISK